MAGFVECSAKALEFGVKSNPRILEASKTGLLVGSGTLDGVAGCHGQAGAEGVLGGWVPLT